MPSRFDLITNISVLHVLSHLQELDVKLIHRKKIMMTIEELKLSRTQPLPISYLRKQVSWGAMDSYLGIAC